MARTAADTRTLQRRLLDLRERVNVVDKILQTKRSDSDLMHALAHCRASVNSLMTDVTEQRFSFRTSKKARRPVSAPRWKTAAARFMR